MTEELVGAPAAVGSEIPSNPAEARDKVDSLLRTRFFTGDGESRDDVVWADALLVTSELVTNAYRHGGGLTNFSAWIEGDELVMSVADRSTAPPVLRLRAPGDFTAGGFGWPMVNRLAKRLSVVSTDTGKRIDVAVPLT
ncbi:ATP-binding protein [Streptomyces sp. col6]|uniref:ATP-binding protein n=1 Tax=Streptomyces sp. col6 TaxID=2478958 RepID=UPI0011CE0AD0|nr:ATP-binding protein [Streptomyces sp. col6]TXS01629.1 ATP-binding protein [Streptomyces sp. col6]